MIPVNWSENFSLYLQFVSHIIYLLSIRFVVFVVFFYTRNVWYFFVLYYIFLLVLFCFDFFFLVIIMRTNTNISCNTILLITIWRFGYHYSSMIKQFWRSFCPLSLRLYHQKAWHLQFLHFEGPSWSWSYGNWIYNYLFNQCLPPLKL